MAKIVSEFVEALILSHPNTPLFLRSYERLFSSEVHSYNLPSRVLKAIKSLEVMLGTTSCKNYKTYAHVL